MTKYTLIIMPDWRKRGMPFDGGFRMKMEVLEKDMQSFIQKCYDEKWIIAKWL